MVETKHPASLRSLIKQFKTPLILILFMVLGFFFRLKMASFFPHQPLYDEKAYLEFARGMIREVFVADYYARTYGYPLLLSVVFRIFGHSNLYAIIITQSILDTLTAGLLLLISMQIFRKNTWAWLTFFLYLFNPLTASYCGLYLSEIWGIFLLVLTLYLFVKDGHFIRYVLCGLTLGMFTFTRIMFWWWSIIIMIGLLVRSRKRIKMIPLIIGFSVTVIYPVMANWRIFKTLSPMPVLPVALLDFTNSFKVGRYPAILTQMYKEIPLEIRDEYWNIVMASEKNRQVFNFYLKPKLQEAGQYIFSHPFVFFLSRLRNIVYYWDKTNLYYYQDPFYPQDRRYLEVGNAIFLFTALVGILFQIRKKKKTTGQKYLPVFVLSLLFYLTVPISLLIPEERHVLPAYPLLCLFIPSGVVMITKTLSFKKISDRV
ncbi:hypothetical protein MUP32_01235 [Candidatus Microgenomates bacterium]|nr:hypothetical protein [Candidatus Microgenomates bacterium]